MLHVTSAGCVAHDLHTIMPWPLELTVGDIARTSEVMVTNLKLHLWIRLLLWRQYTMSGALSLYAFSAFAVFSARNVVLQSWQVCGACSAGSWHFLQHHLQHCSTTVGEHDQGIMDFRGNGFLVKCVGFAALTTLRIPWIWREAREICHHGKNGKLLRLGEYNC